MKQIRNLAAGFIVVLLCLADPAVEAEATAEERSLLIEEALGSSPVGTRPILSPSGPLAVVADLNHDGSSDVALLTTSDTTGRTFTSSELQDLTRLEAREIVVPSLMLEIIFQNLPAFRVVEIGRHRVFQSLEPISLSVGVSPRVGVSVSCRDPDGLYRDLIVVERDGAISRLAVNNTNSEHSTVVDIDSDGDLDAVIMKRLPEAGTGYETFMEWYDLTVSGSRRAGSFPMVRELNLFLDGLAEAIRVGRWDAIVDHVQNGDRSLDVLGYVFVEHDENGEEPSYTFDYYTTNNEIENVVVSRFSENPFPEPVLGQSSSVQIRVENFNGEVRYFTARVQVTDNPFVGRRFAFLTDEVTRQ